MSAHSISIFFQISSPQQYRNGTLMICASTKGIGAMGRRCTTMARKLLFSGLPFRFLDLGFLFLFLISLSSLFWVLDSGGLKGCWSQRWEKALGGDGKWRRAMTVWAVFCCIFWQWLWWERGSLSNGAMKRKKVL
ncbi:hypothetical protein SESBI_24562 [Sesbania bispinosa]|nr:hypothetical protein SESBI_24562 [Sesbania bispinosa]